MTGALIEHAWAAAKENGVGSGLGLRNSTGSCVPEAYLGGNRQSADRQLTADV